MDRRWGTNSSLRAALVAASGALLLAVGWLTVAVAAPSEQNPAQGEHVFSQKCAGCHTIGGGRLVGPDLKGVTAQRPRDWLVNFIVAPDRVIASGDPVAKQLLQEYGTPMPSLGVTNSQAADVLAYIESAPGAAAAPAGGVQAQAPAAAALAGDAVAGRAYFLGERRFANGGPACLGCHAAGTDTFLGGGSWGFDLAYTPSTSNALSASALLQAPQFPGMREAFANRPLTPTEAADVAAFLAASHANPQGTAAAVIGPAAVPPLFVIAGLVLTAVLFALAQLAWQGRFKGVRKPMVGGGSSR